MLELPSELDEKETHRALLLTKRELFLNTVTNSSLDKLDPGKFSDYLSSALAQYEETCSDASDAGVDIVSKVGDW